MKQGKNKKKQEESKVLPPAQHLLHKGSGNK
jgi:hypothetical protein